MNNILSIEHPNAFNFNIKWRLTNCCNYRCSYCVRKNKVDDISNLSVDQELINSALPKVIELILDKNTSTRVELIGGEVSLFNLDYFLNTLLLSTNGLVKRINITTNFSKPSSYYNNLVEICSKYNCELSIMFSWHYEYMKLNNFLNKYNELIKNEFTIYKFEMVSTYENQDKVKEFINECEKIDIEYSVDVDVNIENNQDLIFKVKRNDNHKKYKLTKTNGDILMCGSVRELLKELDEYHSRLIRLKGYYCTLDYDYLYIDKNYHVGYNEQIEACKCYEPIENFSLRKEPIVCPRGCSLCGYMSVFKNKEDIIK